MNEFAFLRMKTEGGQAYYERLALEFWNKLFPPLRGIALEHARWVWEEWGHPLIITCIGRTRQENAAVGGVPESQHLIVPERRWVYGIDFRSRNLPVAARTPFVKRLDRFYNRHTDGYLLALHHGEGTSRHFHVGVNYRYRRYE